MTRKTPAHDTAPPPKEGLPFAEWPRPAGLCGSDVVPGPESHRRSPGPAREEQSIRNWPSWSPALRGPERGHLKEVTPDPPGQRPESSRSRHPREQTRLGPAPRGPPSAPRVSCCDPFRPRCRNPTPQPELRSPSPKQLQRTGTIRGTQGPREENGGDRDAASKAGNCSCFLPTAHC